MSTQATILSIAALAWAVVASPAAPAPVWIRFDDLADGTRVDQQYAEQGVRFVNDYAPDRPFRSSPQITAYAWARSAPQVLVNRAQDDEIYSSAGVPLVLHFAAPISGVGMQLGCVGPCGTLTGATVRLFDCKGQLRAQGQALPRTDFLTPLQVLDPSGQTRLVVIDYGGSLTPEAIDDLAFQPSGLACAETAPPMVQVTSHQDQQVVAGAAINLRGRVNDNSGFIAQVKINGAIVPVTPRPQTNQPPVYEFDWPLTLQPGANPIAVVAWDGDGNKGSANLTLHYGPPATVEVAEFHLTQRGIMQSNTCDVDTPLVAGKFTIVRVRLDARTAGGQPTYVESVQLILYRRVGLVDVVVAVLDGTTFSPYVSWFNSPGELAGVHFWVTGDLVDQPGEYAMRFQAYVGTTAVGSLLEVPCANRSFAFQETRPIKMLVLPLEQPFYSSVVPEHNRQALYAQLDQVARTYPVRDGASGLYEAANTGVKYVIAASHVLCDGTTTNAFCLGTGPAWRFKDAHPQGLARSDHVPVADAAANNCPPNSIIGGRLASTTLVRLPRRTPYGFFTPGAPAQWRAEGKKYAHPLDENHSGVIDGADLSTYVAEFLSTNSNQWLTNLALYRAGDVFRTFRDTNGNHCHDEGEPVAPIAQRWINTGKHVLWAPANKALQDFNQWSSVKLDYASLYLAPDFHPMNPGYHFFGPGQGDEPGHLTWISPGLDTNWQASDNVLPHELGHNFGLSHENVSIPAWQAYVYHRRVNAATAFTAMNPFVMSPDRSFLRAAHYQQVFNDLVGSGTTAGAPHPPAPEVASPALVLLGVVRLEGELAQLDVVATTAETFSDPDPRSVWLARVGHPRGVLEHPFPVTFGDAHPETVMEPVGSFRVTLPLPEGTDWIEIRRGRTVMARRQRSANAPRVTVRRPAGGEVFGAQDLVTVAWSARDDDGDPLTCSVLYTPDGNCWFPLAAGLTASSWDWNLAAVPGGAEARIRVVVADGFNQAFDDSEGFFQVEGKPPLVSILNPGPGARFLQGQAIPLRGFALDPEGSPLGIAWFIDDQAVATNLTALVPSPAPGPHHLTLAVRDRQGLLATAATSFSVEADSDRDGMSDVFEEESGLDISRAADALEDPDADGLNNFDEAWRGLNPRDRDTDQDGVPDGEEVQRGFDPRDAGSTPPCVPLPEGLVSWWPGDGQAQDAIGENHGRLERGAGFAPGKSGEAFRFEGGAGMVVRHHPSLLPATLTVTAWIHPTSYEGNRVLEKGGWRVGGGYGFEFNPFGSLGIRFVVWSEGPATIDSDAPVPLRAWTHIAGTFDGATMRLYVNGVEQSGTRLATLTGNTAPLTIGRASGGDDLYFLGLIDEVQLYRRALAGEEIAALYQAGSAGLCKGCLSGPPRLDIYRAASAVGLFWPRCADWVLEEAPELGAPYTAWLQVAPTLYQTNGLRVQATLSLPTGHRFYRLHKP